jgi:PBSX family phage terminase large subunit
MPSLITTKQRQFLLEPFSRINLLEGSVRSGKTWISLVKWAMFVRSRPQGELFMMVGKTREALQFNCVGLLEDLAGADFKCNARSNVGYLYGREIRLLGANDEKAASKIKGSTLAGAYIDELSEIPESFYKMTLSRLSVSGAVLLATTNPDSPNNYVFTDIIENEDISRKCWKFLLDDNTFLPKEYIENIKKEYTGVFFERYILGNWVIAEGLVYPDYDNTVKTEPRDYTEYAVSMDYGTQNPTVMLLWGRHGGTWYAVREYEHSGRETNIQKTDAEYYAELEKLCADVPVQTGAKIELIIDPSAASFIAVAQQGHRFKVRKADNDVLNGIRNTASALSDRRILINDCCARTIREFGLYSWDSRAAEDAVIKEDDHGMDAVRYFIQTKRIYKDRRYYADVSRPTASAN